MLEYLNNIMQFAVGNLDISTGIKYQFIMCGITSMLYGLLVLILDFCYFRYSKKSVFNLSYISSGTLWIILFYAGGAGVSGFFFSMLNVITPTNLGCFTVSVAWPFIFPKIIYQKQLENEPEEPSDGRKLL